MPSREEAAPPKVELVVYSGPNILPVKRGEGPDHGGTNVYFVNGVPQCPNKHGDLILVGHQAGMPSYYYCLRCRVALHRKEWLLPPPPYGNAQVRDPWEATEMVGEKHFRRLMERPLTEFALALQREVGDYLDLVSRDAGWGYKAHTPSTVAKRMDALADVYVLIVRNAVRQGIAREAFHQAVMTKMARVAAAMQRPKTPSTSRKTSRSKR